MEEATEDKMPAVPTAEQPPRSDYVSQNPFKVAKVVHLTNMCPSPATTAALADKNSSTVTSETPSTSKRQNASTMWLNPPAKFPENISSNTPYTTEEDNEILRFSAKHLDKVNGKAIWRDLQDSGKIPNRSFESLRSRYPRHLQDKLSNQYL